MESEKADRLSVEALGVQHDRSGFESGVESLDRYFRTQAGQDARKRLAASFVLLLEDGSLAGYYTLSSTAVKLPELPETLARKLPRYPLVPATLLGRLAIDRRYRGKGYGRFLLADLGRGQSVSDDRRAGASRCGSRCKE